MKGNEKLDFLPIEFVSSFVERLVQSAGDQEILLATLLLTQDTASSGLQGWLYASLTRRDPKTLDIVGDLYDGTPTFSADGSKMTWKLRKGMKWSDGMPLTSADVVFT